MAESVKLVIYIISFILLARLLVKEKKAWLLSLVFVCGSIILLNTNLVDELSEDVKIVWALLTLVGCAISYFIMTNSKHKKSQNNSD